jgi:Zn-dependent protease/predicted transcriptional regulator
MSGSSWRLMRVGGIDVKIDASWLIIAALVSISLYFGLSVVYPEVGTVAAAAISLLGAMLFFGSVLVHELMHAFVARRRGFTVTDITLYLFGGATQANIESKGPADEFIVSIVGPLTSFGLAILFGIARATVLAVEDGALAGILGYLAWANTLLGVFNLLPGLPLDGGRVLRSVLWRTTGDIDRSTRIASVAGEVIGYGLIVVGVFVFFAGAIFQGLWFAAIGWFLATSARAAYAEMRMRRALERVEALEIMEADPIRIPAGTTIATAVNEYLLRHDHDAFGIEDEGRVVGVVTLVSVRKVARAEWSMHRISEVMTPITAANVVDPHTPMDKVLDRFEGAADSIAVGDRDHVVGVITPWDLTVWLRRRTLAA